MSEEIGWFERSKRRLMALIDEYGYIALGVYAVLTTLTIGGAYIAIRSGMETESTAGPLAGAWAFSQILRPVKVAVTVLITPFVARVIRGPASKTKDGESENPDGSSET